METKLLSKMDELITDTARLHELAKEYKQAVIYKSCTYDVRPLTGRWDYYMLFEIESKKRVQDGSPREIRKWLERRNIPPEKVYNYSIIEPKTNQP